MAGPFRPAVPPSLCRRHFPRVSRQVWKKGSSFEFGSTWLLARMGTAEVDRVVPVSPDDLERKKLAIFRINPEGSGHVSRRRGPREFWQRAEDRNRHTARSTMTSACPSLRAGGFVQWKWHSEC